jgi:hypothetical protein
VGLALAGSLLWALPLSAQSEVRAATIPRVERPPRIADFMPGPLTGALTNGNGNAVPVTDGGAVALPAPAMYAGISIADFRQREPGDGEPVSQATTAYLSYDDANLYVVFVCADDSARVRANVNRREVIDDDDQVLVYLDTFRDGERAYVFAVNPLGIQRDGIRFERADEEDMSFDAVWSSEGRLTADGYVVRIAIPFRSLRFSNDSTHTWGIALGRVIQRNNEESFWPHLTKQVKGFIPQFAPVDGLSGISRPRYLQVNPYAAAARARVLDTDAAQHVGERDQRIGMDAMMVVRDALTIDGTLNPDFSQVESDDPQVTVNQRFEVQFPEKRPFFLENASYFQTPVELFFSRRIVDPGAGLRLTGKMGRWAVGTLAMNDRAQDRLPADDPLAGHDAWAGVVRVERETGEESTVGLLLTDREFQTSLKFDRMLAGDFLWRVGRNWELLGQVMHSANREHDGTQVSGYGGLVQAARRGRHFDYTGRYREFSPDFAAPLGFVRRVGYRDTRHDTEYTFRPDGLVTKYGPSLEMLWVWDHATGQLADREIEAKFQMELRGNTELTLRRTEFYEQFDGLSFHPGISAIEARTDWLKWVGGQLAYSWGTAVNHDPAEGLVASLGNAVEAEFGLTLRPTPQILLETAYVYSSLRTDPGSDLIFAERQLRTKLNYQFNRELSLRAIVDFGALDADTTLVDQQRERTWGYDFLFTYLLHPGTAVYLGYTDRYENVTLLRTPTPDVVASRYPDVSVARQVFVKVSYLWRF